MQGKIWQNAQPFFDGAARTFQLHPPFLNTLKPLVSVSGFVIYTD
jgi:hypothetical protein